MATIICNKLKIILPDVIELTQGRFIKAREATYNENVVFETIQSIFQLDHRLSNYLKCIAIKLDIEKGYDKVS